MKTFSEIQFPSLIIGTCVTLSVPGVDLEPLDFGTIVGVIIDIKNVEHQIKTKNGVIKSSFHVQI